MHKEANPESGSQSQRCQNQETAPSNENTFLALNLAAAQRGRTFMSEKFMSCLHLAQDNDN